MNSFVCSNNIHYLTGLSGISSGAGGLRIQTTDLTSKRW